MQPLKETKVYIPTLENDFDVAGTTIKDNRLIGLKEQNLYCFTKQEMLLFKRQFALEVLNKTKDTDINTAWHNIKKELQAEFENNE